MKQCKYCNKYARVGFNTCFGHANLEKVTKKGNKTTQKPSKLKTDKHNPYQFRSQIELFKYKWTNSTKRCFVTGNGLEIYENTPYFLHLFAHVIRKKAFPKFKLYVNNIVLLEPEIHELYDNAVLDKILKYEKEHNVSFRTLFELERLVYEEYAKEFGRGTSPRKVVDRYFG